jgi:hypothetical protein
MLDCCRYAGMEAASAGLAGRGPVAYALGCGGVLVPSMWTPCGVVIL